jgi:hypothetical protein
MIPNIINIKASIINGINGREIARIFPFDNQFPCPLSYCQYSVECNIKMLTRENDAGNGTRISVHKILEIGPLSEDLI